MALVIFSFEFCAGRPGGGVNPSGIPLYVVVAGIGEVIEGVEKSQAMPIFLGQV